MAKQQRDPPPWQDHMSDGCSGVPNYGYRIPCLRHDIRCYYGGDADDKSLCDDLLYLEMQDPRYVESRFWRFVARNGLARTRWAGVRFITINYPPGHPNRRAPDNSLEVFNWLGPGWQNMESKEEENEEVALVHHRRNSEVGAGLHADRRTGERRKHRS